jgi:O-antigen ligase
VFAPTNEECELTSKKVNDFVNSLSRNEKSETVWAFVVGLFASFLLVVGPLQVLVPKIDEVLSVITILLIVVSVWRLRSGLPSSLAVSGLILLALGVLLICAQLIPLPASIWSTFPGRQTVLDTLSATKIEPGQMPLSLDPFATRGIVLYIVPSIGLFFASLSISPQSRKTWAITVVAAAISCAMLGLVQKFQGPDSSFFLNSNPVGDSSAKGTFFNRNFFAAQLYCTIPLVSALGVATLSGRAINRFVEASMLLVYFIALMAALGASGSRGGLGLAMLAVLLSTALAWSGRNQAAETTNSRRWMFPLTILALLLVAQFGIVGLLRIAETDTATDLRGTMAANTWEAIKAYFPVGSGFGSFVPIYKLFESPEQLFPQFVNNAHNDWLQLALEGGLPMIILMIGFVAWYLVASLKVWRTGSNSIEDLLLRAASLIILLLLLHSIFDYPLRTRALMGLFAVCCGFLAYGVKIKPFRNKIRPSMGKGLVEPEPRPARTSPYFVVKKQNDAS